MFRAASLSVFACTCAWLAPLRAQGTDLGQQLESWRAEHGQAWQMVEDPSTGFARFVFGGSAEPAFEPRHEADLVALALLFAESSSALTGIEPPTLVEGEVVFLPLGNAASSDKLSVQLRQEVAGVPVVRGFFNVLFDASGRLLSIDTSALPDVAGLDLRPALSPAAAASRAAEIFRAEHGLDPDSLSEPELVIYPALAIGRKQAVLAWQVSAAWQREGPEPLARTYWIDARDGERVDSAQEIHHDVSGNVRSLATPGLQPDKTPNVPQQEAMRNLRVVSSKGNATTDVNGDFTIAGAAPPVDATVLYDGTWAAVHNVAGPDHSAAALFTQSSGNQIQMNLLGDPLVTAQANAFNWINRLHDWTKAVNPADPSVDFKATAFCNLPAPCNAFYNGIAVNFFIDTVICVNSSYSTVVVHEMGHWYNVRYSSGNGGDGFGEGNADVFAMYVADDAIVGADFSGPGTFIRTGWNTRPYCGDCCGGCYGEVHDDGEVLMGALWKVRARLKTSLGAAQGRVSADTLFNAWMNAYNDGSIHSIIETHWLVLDDDDGNLLNGTPHFAEIDGGFRDQQFPGFALPCSPPAAYCTAKTSSIGTLPSIGWAGNATLAANNFKVSVSAAVPAKNGLFFWGSAPNSAPFSGGTLCVAPPTQRGPVLALDATGAGQMAVAIDPSMVGTTRYFQFWFRDPQHPDGTGIGLSNGLRVVFCAN
jgi:hypothetical protein